MNPYRIYRDEWARALAVQTTATKYRTFVAMPFQERFSYRSREILSGVIGAAVDGANRRGQTPRQFDIPERIDVPMGAAVITEEIILRIHLRLRLKRTDRELCKVLAFVTALEEASFASGELLLTHDEWKAFISFEDFIVLARFLAGPST